jgi:hypothetical protein
VNPFESKIRARLLDAGVISATDLIEAIPAWSFGANYEGAILWRIVPVSVAVGAGVALADKWNVRSPLLIIALCGVAASVGGWIGDRRQRGRRGSLPAPPKRRAFGVALSGRRLLVVTGDERGQMTGDIQEYVGIVRNVHVTDVKRLGLVTARRYRIELAGEAELNFEVQATSSAEAFFKRVTSLVFDPPTSQAG